VGRHLEVFPADAGDDVADVTFFIETLIKDLLDQAR
jgi:hypothetical protein